MHNFSINSLSSYLAYDVQTVQIPTQKVGSDNHVLVSSGILIKKDAKVPFCIHCNYPIEVSSGNHYFCPTCDGSLCDDEIITEVYEYNEFGMCNVLNELFKIPIKPKSIIPGLYELGMHQRCKIYYTRCYTSEHKRRLKDVKKRFIITGSPNYEDNDNIICLDRICRIENNEIIVDARFSGYIVQQIVQPAVDKRSVKTSIRRPDIVEYYLIRARQVLNGEVECKRPTLKEVIAYLTTKGIEADEDDIKNDIRTLNKQKCTLVGDVNFKLLYDCLESQNIEELEIAMKTDFTESMKTTIVRSSKSNQTAARNQEDYEKKNDSNNPNRCKNLAQRGMRMQKSWSA